MASSLGAPQKGSANVDLNIVPFIDLMSCMTAFLLVTAVWVSQTQLPTQPKGKAGGGIEAEIPHVAVLLQHDQILVTSYPTGDTTAVPAQDWDKLGSALTALRATEPQPLEVAAESTRTEPVAYQQLVSAMDTAMKSGYPDVEITDPMSLR